MGGSRQLGIGCLAPPVSLPSAAQRCCRRLEQGGVCPLGLPQRLKRFLCRNQRAAHVAASRDLQGSGGFVAVGGWVSGSACVCGGVCGGGWWDIYGYTHIYIHIYIHKHSRAAGSAGAWPSAEQRLRSSAAGAAPNELAGKLAAGLQGQWRGQAARLQCCQPRGTFGGGTPQTPAAAAP